MELCYHEELVTPKNCQVMTEDEMTYVEGGRLAYISNTMCKNICNSAIAAGIGSVAEVKSKLGKAIAIFGANTRVTGWLTAGLVGSYATGFAGYLVAAACTNKKGVGVYLSTTAGVSFSVE